MPLTQTAQTLTGLVGIILISVTVYTLFSPPTRVNERTGPGGLVERGVGPADQPALTLAVFGTGAVLLMFAANGYAFSSFKFSGITVDTATVDAAALLAASKDPALPAAELALVGDGPDPAPATADPAGWVPATLEGLAVYAPAAISPEVIADALSAWPAECGPRPASANRVEYGLRRAGQGNHPWFLKFRDRLRVRVTYGGRGNREPTVRPAESQ